MDNPETHVILGPIHYDNKQKHNTRALRQWATRTSLKKNRNECRCSRRIRSCCFLLNTGLFDNKVMSSIPALFKCTHLFFTKKNYPPLPDKTKILMKVALNTNDPCAYISIQVCLLLLHMNFCSCSECFFFIFWAVHCLTLELFRRYKLSKWTSNYNKLIIVLRLT